jgi:cobalamin biosynthesis Mg chelatase CobN
MSGFFDWINLLQQKQTDSSYKGFTWRSGIRIFVNFSLKLENINANHFLNNIPQDWYITKNSKSKTSWYIFHYLMKTYSYECVATPKERLNLLSYFMPNTDASLFTTFFLTTAFDPKALPFWCLLRFLEDTHSESKRSDYLDTPDMYELENSFASEQIIIEQLKPDQEFFPTVTNEGEARDRENNTIEIITRTCGSRIHLALLTKLKTRLESQPIQDFCNRDKKQKWLRNSNRERYLKLTDLLINKITTTNNADTSDPSTSSAPPTP